MWLLVNEGETPVEARVSLPVHTGIGAYDLWENRLEALESADGAEGREFFPRLERRQSLLLFACLSAGEWEALPRPGPAGETIGPEAFALTAEEPERQRKIYTAAVPAMDCPLTVCLEAREMAELWAEDTFCGAAFWAPQRLRVPAEIMRRGPVTLRLAVTGSLANRYGRPVPYGL